MNRVIQYGSPYYGTHSWDQLIWRAYETPPPSTDPPSETTVPNSESGGSAQESGVLSRDEFNQFRQTVSEQFSGIGQQITEGFGWVKENLPVVSPADGEVPDSPLENPAETVIEVVDRPTIPNKRARTRLNLGRLFQ